MESRSESLIAAEAVERIIASAEAAAGGIGRRTEAELGRIAAQLDARATIEAAERRLRLERLRVDLAERAEALSGAYAAIVEQLAALEAALAEERRGAEEAAGGDSQRLARIRMTLRERQRMELSSELPAQPAPPFPLIPQDRSRRRRWLPWQREAA